MFCWCAFPLASALRSTGSAAECSALFAGFLATMASSDFPRPYIIGVGLVAFPMRTLGAYCHRSDAGSPRFRRAPFLRDAVFDPAERQHLAKRCRTCCLRRCLPPRPLQISGFRGSIAHPTGSLCTLRCRRHRRPRNTHYRAPATAYPSRTCTGRTTPAFLAHKQSRQEAVAPGLLRHYVPRNDELKLRAVALGLAGFRERGDQMIEPVAGALELGGEIAAVVGVDRRVERQPTSHVDSGAGETIELRRIVGEQADTRAAEHLEHARGNAVVALVVVEAEGGVGVDRVEALILELISAHLVDEPDAAPFLLEIEDHAAAGLVEPRQRELELVAAVAAARAEHVAGEAGRMQPHRHRLGKNRLANHDRDRVAAHPTAKNDETS